MDHFLKTIYDDIMSIAETLVIKRQDLADAAETYESRVNFDRYLAIIKGVDRFQDYNHDVDIMQEVLPQEEWAYITYGNLFMPDQYKDAILAKTRERYGNYEELNDYYRCLNGLPNMSDKNFIYITDIQNIPTDVPIHEMTTEQISILMNKGKLQSLILSFPAKEYLKFLGPNKIDIVEARRAQRFDILSIGTPNNPLSKELFMKEYSRARNFIMVTSYSNQMFIDKDLYDGFIGLLILTQTIRNCLNIDVLANQFYSAEIMDNILRSYGLYDYFSALPNVYKKRLIKNLNNILSRKGTEKVLLDICDIFGYDNITVNRYYLLKRHKKDVNGDFIFPKLGNGDPDYDATYELDFLKVDVKDQDSININKENILDYSSVVETDPLWDMSAADTTRLKSEDFNLMLSKYISIEAAYNISELMYEISYFINLILDSKSSLSQLKVSNVYSASLSSNLFTMIVFLLATLSKKAGFDGNIVYSGVGVATIYKYNLSDISTQLNDIISKYKLTIPNEYKTLNKANGIILSPDEIINVYVKNSKVYDFLISEIRSCKDYTKYIGLTKLKNVMFTANNVESIFTKSNGQVATTYLDMLSDIEPVLGTTITSTVDQDEIDKLALYILNQLQEFFNSDKLRFLFINTPDMHDKLMKVNLKQTVELLKASSIEIDTIDIFFKIDKDPNTIRFFDKCSTLKNLHRRDRIQTKDAVAVHKTIYVSDSLQLSDSSEEI